MAGFMIRQHTLRRLLACAGLSVAISASAASLPTDTPPSTRPVETEQVDAVVKAWAQSWDRGDVPQYLGQYADNFQPSGGLTRSQWEQQRRARLKTSAIRHVILSNVQVAVHTGTAQAQFTQHYLDMDLMSTARKRLTLVKQAGAWKIREELVEAERIVRR
ncbi:nuclear transport factor 2 family protein [Uliginosibacterium sp. H3]|uniref:Nuclear transport factor 2 family protein n=1 Tax=Uliginosibacterium silvisoli TaxID=3114758 RepID=A0ABU6K1M7_9RHOO|nr:nuclear transport factor 2 family protein [Uliginosibacterium sp. H3]